MGTKYLLILATAFLAGLFCCLGIAHFYPLEPPPLPTPKVETEKILVAKVDLPAGTELTADLVAIAEVPFDDVPLGAVSRFNDVYRKKTTAPILIGKPIDTDLLFDPFAEGDSGNYIPPGFQIAPILIVQNQGGKAPEVNQAVDLVLQPKPGVQRQEPLLIAENVNIQTVESINSANGKKKYTVTLLISNEQAKAIANADRERRLQVLVRGDDPADGSEPLEIFQPDDFQTEPAPLPVVSSASPAYESKFPPAETPPETTQTTPNIHISAKPVISSEVNTTESFSTPPRPHYGTTLFRPRASE